MKDDVCSDGPFMVELKVFITNPDNEEEGGHVIYALPPGVVPTDDSVKEGLAKAASAAAEHGYVLMDRHQFVVEQLGVGRVAVPGPRDFRLKPCS